MTKIKTINPIVRILWTKKQQIIPNKKKKIPRKQKYRKYTPGAAGFFYVWASGATYTYGRGLVYDLKIQISGRVCTQVTGTAPLAHAYPRKSHTKPLFLLGFFLG